MADKNVSMCLGQCPNCDEWIDHYAIHPVDGIMTPDTEAMLNGEDRWELQRIIICPHCNERIKGFSEIKYSEAEALKRLDQMRNPPTKQVQS